MRLLRITPKASEIAFSLLKHVHASSDWFPPLKNAAGGALRIVQLVKGFRSHKKDWGNFGDHVQGAVASLVRLLPSTSVPREDLKQGIVKLRDSLHLIVKDIETRQGDPTRKPSYTSIEAQKAIQGMRTKIDSALCVFPLGSSSLDVAKLLEGLDIKKHVTLLHAKLGDEIVTNIEMSNNMLVNTSENPTKQATSFHTHEALNSTVNNVNGNQHIINEYHGAKSEVTGKWRESLSRVPDAKFDPERGCLDQTRKELIAAIVEWAMSPTSPAVCWLYGLAGMGKTTISNSAAACLKQLAYLGGSFLFSRAVEARNKPDHLFTTIAFQMCSDRDFAAEIDIVLSEDPDVGRPGSSLLNQFQELIERPLNAKGNHPENPVVIVLDALDECGTERDRRSLLDVICRHRGVHASRLKFFITSRPEPDIAISLSSPLACPLNLSDSQSGFIDSTRDIMAFVDTQMKRTANIYRLGVDWPGPELRELLVQKADGLFIWASTACEFIHDQDSRSPIKRLKVILDDNYNASVVPASARQWQRLDKLYRQVLQEAVAGEDSNAISGQVREILGAIVVALNPLSSLILAGLFAIQPDDTTIWQRLRKLQSVLIVPKDDRDPVRIIHPSFFDFLTDANRCTDPRFYISMPYHHEILAQQCIWRMQQLGSLRRDICRLGKAPILNSTIKQELLDQYIPNDLRYACEFWAEHIYRSSGDINELRPLVEEFLFEHLLHWLEVLSLLDKFGSAVALLRKVNEWLQKADVGGSAEAQALLHDAIRFFREFHAPIAASASQIYISALPFAPQYSPIFRTFSNRYDCKANVVSGARPHWPSNISIGCEEVMLHLAFSPDGNRVVCGSKRIIYVYDLSVGGRVGLPLTGHTDDITSVAFTANGKHVLSSSEDGSVRLWDTRINAQVDAVHHDGHKILQAVPTRDGATINYLSYCDSAVSEDSVASKDAVANEDCDASEDRDAPLKYCDLFIMSISLAPGGSHFLHPSRTTKQLCRKQRLSGYDECYPRMTLSVCSAYTATNQEECIRVWDTKTAAVISKPLQMPESVGFVSFSPNSNWILCIASIWAEEDITKVWDWRTGSVVYEFSNPYPTIYHPVVAFSPEGNKIFLASSALAYDIRAWKFSEGGLVGVGEPWKASGSIWAIASSPDGALLVSAANDKSLCVWDTHAAAVPEQQSLPEPTAGMPSSVDHPLRQTIRQSPITMVLSPDGTQLATTEVETSESECILRVAPWSRPSDTINISACYPYKVAFSPDGSRIVFQPSYYTVGVWNSVTGYTITRDLGYFIDKIIFSPDGKRLFGCSGEHSGKQGWTWDFESDTICVFSETKSFAAMSGSRSGHILATGNREGDVCLRDPQTGILTGGPLKGHTAWVCSVAFSPDGTRLVSGSRDRTVQVWDVEKRISVGLPLEGHTNWVTSVSYSPDGKWIISKSEYQRLVWDARDLSSANLSTVGALSRRFVPGASFLHLTRDGWVVDLGNNPILWVPADIRKLRAAQRSSLVFDGLGGLRLVDVSDIAV